MGSSHIRRQSDRPQPSDSHHHPLDPPHRAQPDSTQSHHIPALPTYRTPPLEPYPTKSSLCWLVEILGCRRTGICERDHRLASGMRCVSPRGNRRRCTLDEAERYRPAAKSAFRDGRWSYIFASYGGCLVGWGGHFTDICREGRVGGRQSE